MALYDRLKQQLERTLAELQFDLMRCNDLYRLNHLLNEHAKHTEKLAQMSAMEIMELESLFD